MFRNDMVYLFDRTIKNIPSKYIYYKNIICDSRNPPLNDISLKNA